MTRRPNGGLPARRAVVRWAWRLFRREWRQQVLVLGLLAVAVAATVVAAAAGYHVAPVPQARFGTAKQMFEVDRSDPRGAPPVVAAARDWFGRIEVIGHRNVPVPGSAQSVEVRAQDPHGPYGAPTLRLLAGRYPTGTSEVAVTDGVAVTLGLRVGAPLTLAGESWTVVGTVENPANLRSEFVLVAPDPPDPQESLTVLTAADQARFDEFRRAHGMSTFDIRPVGTRTAAAAGVFGLFAVSMLLICLVAAAGFAVVAHRRLRQLGLLAALGATKRHLRLVLLADGAVVGAVAAVVGAAAGLLLWIALVPRLETATAHRIDRLDLPWWQIVLAMLLTGLTSTAAAWRPARTVARVPVTLALSARPPRPRPARRSAVAAVVLIGTGVGCVGLAGRSNPLLANALEIPELGLISMGIVAIGAGLLFVSPLAIQLLAAAGARLPVAPRLALRDLARHQGRSGAALAAISLALAISTAVVALVKATDDGTGPQPLRWTLTGAGAGLALGVLAMTIGLIRAEAASDLRTLAATGATSRIRRTLTATTAAGLALLGAALGIAVAYLCLAAGAGSHIGALARIPVLELVTTLAGVPLVAAAAGWVLAGRRPSALRRARLE